MYPELIVIPEERLFEYLSGLDRPVMEYDLMKKIIPPPDGTDDGRTLFVKHFSLYHALYGLKFSAGCKGYYLHLDCMRIRLVRIPGAGHCRHYNPENGTFCRSEAHGDYCEAHETLYAGCRSAITIDYLQDFYCDEGNITFGDSEILEKLMTGVLRYSIRRKEIDGALEFFGIHAPGRKTITRRYRELACIYHPDRCGGSDEMMKRLNSSYLILKEVFIV